VAGLLRWAADRLDEQGCGRPYLEAELLLAHVLGWDRTRLHAYPEHAIRPSEATVFEGLIHRRERREPLPYILETREFYGLEFHVNSHVLIPRPETEQLVELTWEMVSQRENPRPQIVDVGTGSGAIAVTLANLLSEATVYGIDISYPALKVAAANAARQGVKERVHLMQSDLLTALGGRVDAIVANLPYVAWDERKGLPPEVKQYEPWLALDGGPEGLDPLHQLLAQAPGRLAVDGVICCEIGATQGARALDLAREAFPHAQCKLYQDYGGKDRIITVELEKGAKAYG
jgi:release factor glutamine methyltransferase